MFHPYPKRTTLLLRALGTLRALRPALAALALLASLGLGSPAAKAQLLTTDTRYTLQGLLDSVLLGTGITAYNLTYTTGDTGQVGFFYGATPGLGLTPLQMDSGIVLSTGSIYDHGSTHGVRGPSTCGQSISNGYNNSDPDLDTLAAGSGLTTHDAVVVEFDFIPISDSVKFRYMFGSEEYPAYVGTQFNDVFGFFLSGLSTPMAKHNIARVPGSSTIISINNVNDGNQGCSGTPGGLPGPCVNCAYYVDSRGQTVWQADGHTTKLTAGEAVLCGEVYHIKLAIADIGDGAWDSQVFLEALSFNADGITLVSDSNAPGRINDSTYVEGCGRPRLIIKRATNLPNSELVTITPFGTAINGIDYTQVTDSVVFAPGQTTDTLYLDVLADGIAEGLEWVSFNITSSNPCFSSSVSSDTFYIQDAPKLIAAAYGDTTLDCPNQPVTVGATASGGGNSVYHYVWSNGQTAQSFTQPYSVTTTLYVMAIDSCNTPSEFDSVTITVPIRAPFVVNPVSDSIGYCLYRSVDLVAHAAGGTPPYTYQWQGGFPAGDSVRTAPAGTQQYTIVATDACGRTASATVTAIPSPVIADFRIDSVTFDTWQFTNKSSSEAVSYYWKFGDGDTSTALDPPHTYADTGSYIITLVAGNADGCTDTAKQYLTVPKGFDFFLPNSFSPDGDGNNEVFLPAGRGIKTFHMDIYSRWGERVFSSDDANVGWDGSWKGKPAPVGTYTYYLQIGGVFKVYYAPSGIVTLIR